MPLPAATSWETDAAFQDAVHELGPEEQAQLAAFRERYRPGGPMGDEGWVDGTPIRRALEEQVRFDQQAAEAQAEADRKVAAREARLDAMRAIVDLRLTGVEAHIADWRTDRKAEVYATFRVENRDARQVNGFKGTVGVRKGARVLAEIPVLFGEKLGGRTGTEWRYDFEYDPSSASQQLLSTTPLAGLTVEWIPARVDLSDGTVLTLDGALSTGATGLP